MCQEMNQALAGSSGKNCYHILPTPKIFTPFLLKENSPWTLTVGWANNERDWSVNVRPPASLPRQSVNVLSLQSVKLSLSLMTELTEKKGYGVSVKCCNHLSAWESERAVWTTILVPLVVGKQCSFKLFRGTVVFTNEMSDPEGLA